MNVFIIPLNTDSGPVAKSIGVLIAFAYPSPRVMLMACRVDGGDSVEFKHESMLESATLYSTWSLVTGSYQVSTGAHCA